MKIGQNFDMQAMFKKPPANAGGPEFGGGMPQMKAPQGAGNPFQVAGNLNMPQQGGYPGAAGNRLNISA
jgi:hypothetical protein